MILDMDNCTCNPIFWVICNECDGDGCFACDDGYIQQDSEHPDQLQIIVHQEGCQIGIEQAFESIK